MYIGKYHLQKICRHQGSCYAKYINKKVGNLMTLSLEKIDFMPMGVFSIMRKMSLILNINDQTADRSLGLSHL